MVLRRAPVSDSVADILLERIASGVYKVGERLPTERQLAESLGVSRAGIREGLNRLQSLGLIVTVRGLGGGSRVQELDSAFLARALALMLKVNGLTREHLVEARRVLAPQVAALAAQRATNEDIHALETISQGIDATRSDQAQRSTFAFHVRLTEACGNPILKAAMTPVLNLVEPLVDPSQIVAVMQAIKAHDPDRARASMTRCLEPVPPLPDVALPGPTAAAHATRPG